MSKAVMVAYLLAQAGMVPIISEQKKQALERKDQQAYQKYGQSKIFENNHHQKGFSGTPLKRVQQPKKR